MGNRFGRRTEVNPRGVRRPRDGRGGAGRGRMDGSGQGVGQPGGLRRNQNTTPCDPPKRPGFGRGGNR